MRKNQNRFHQDQNYDQFQIPSLPSSSKMSTTIDLKSVMNSENKKISMDAKIWGPHYWFVLFTMASCYPKNPNDVTKKKILRIYSKSPTVYAN